MHTGTAQTTPARTITAGGSAVDPASVAIIGQRDHGTHHHHFAVREVDQLDDAVHHGVAQRHDRVYASQRQSIYHLLQEDIHQSRIACSPKPGTDVKMARVK